MKAIVLKDVMLRDGSSQEVTVLRPGDVVEVAYHPYEQDIYVVKEGAVMNLYLKVDVQASRALTLNEVAAQVSERFDLKERYSYARAWHWLSQGLLPNAVKWHDAGDRGHSKWLVPLCDVREFRLPEGSRQPYSKKGDETDE